MADPGCDALALETDSRCAAQRHPDQPGGAPNTMAASIRFAAEEMENTDAVP